jgi:hypothetical protein
MKSIIDHKAYLDEPIEFLENSFASFSLDILSILIFFDSWIAESK